MNIDAFVNWINTHYITYRQRYLMQRQDGDGYSTINKPLHDGLLKAHLEQNITIGVFAGRLITKFICFDVDAREDAQAVTRDLIELLIVKYGLSAANILLSASGSKGYHVELFFDEPITLQAAKQFYMIVLHDLSVTSNIVELRPTAQGVKLPLSLHRKTGAICHILDHAYFKPLPATALFDVEQIETALFCEQLNDYWTYKPLRITETEAVAFEAVVDDMQLDIPIDYSERIQYAIQHKMLLYPNTRHTTTLLLAIYFKDLGISYPDTMRHIYDILHHSFVVQRDFYSTDTTTLLIDVEINRITKIVYERDYHIHHTRSNKPLRFYKEDVLFTLTPKRLNVQKLLFSMLCHSKRFATKDGVFYMSYAQMTAYGNTGDRKRLIAAVNELERIDCLKIVSRNVGKKNNPLARGEEKYKKAVNRYRLNVKQSNLPGDPFFELQDATVENLFELASALVSGEELKAVVGKDKFYRYYKHYYTA